jgi:hypothetical protein
MRPHTVNQADHCEVLASKVQYRPGMFDCTVQRQHGLRRALKSRGHAGPSSNSSRTRRTYSQPDGSRRDAVGVHPRWRWWSAESRALARTMAGELVATNRRRKATDIRGELTGDQMERVGDNIVTCCCRPRAIVLTPCEEPAEELLRRVRVAPPLDQDIAHVPVLIHRGYCPGIGHQSICIRLVGLTL